MIDGLDRVSAQEADQLLAEARALVHVWRNVSVLATALPSIALPDEERVVVAPWPIERGASLFHAAVGDDHYWREWNGETLELLQNPLTAPGLAARVLTGRDTRVSRLDVLAELSRTVISLRSTEVSNETWHDLSRLAADVLNQPALVAAPSFAPLPRLRRLVATGMVIAEADTLTFALPIFEVYFGAEAIRANLIPLNAVAAGNSFPRWRYALAFALSTATPVDQERLMLALAGTNPASAFWLLNEMGGESAKAEPHDDATIAAILARHGTVAAEDSPGNAIRARLWLREAEEALLAGLGPLAEALAHHRDGQLTQWGVWLENGYLTLARARDRVPPPAVVQLTEIHPQMSLASGWRPWSQFRFPTADLGRWTHAQGTLQAKLQRLVARRALRVPSDSWLARERTYHLSESVYQFGVSRRRPIVLGDLKEKVNAWVERANNSEGSTWGPDKVDSDDIKWLAEQLALEQDDHLRPPWPDGDRPYARHWIWESFSPEMTLTIATDVVREALIGYRQIVDSNFPEFGNAMGLYSMQPLRAEGFVDRPENSADAFGVYMVLMLHSERDQPHSGVPAVDLTLATDANRSSIWERGRTHWERTPRPRFAQDPVQDVELQLHTDRRATNLAYKWLAKDLAALGWLREQIRYFD